MFWNLPGSQNFILEESCTSGVKSEFFNQLQKEQVPLN